MDRSRGPRHAAFCVLGWRYSCLCLLGFTKNIRKRMIMDRSRPRLR
jgi:hypothetical protein